MEIMETNEIMLILARLAQSEGLHVESPNNDDGKKESWTPDCKGKVPVLGYTGGGVIYIPPDSPPATRSSPRSGVVNPALLPELSPVTRSGTSRGAVIPPEYLPGAPSSFGGLGGRLKLDDVLPFTQTPLSSSGTVWTAVSGLVWNAASRVWKYVTRSYGVAVNVQVVPVNDLLMSLRDPHRQTLAARMKEIMREHAVVDLNALADTIQQDSSLVRQIILKQLVDYLIEDMSLSVRIPAGHESLEYSSNP